jgi:small subunit ribosomal protein S6
MTAQKRMREYETIFVMRPELDDKAAKDLMLAQKERIEKLGGKNLKVTALGRRKLAWECQKETRGIYVHHHFLGEPGIIKEFERALSIDDNILIRQSVLLNDSVDPELAKVEEDVLVPPVYKEKREGSDRRRFGDRGDGFDDNSDFDNRRRYDDDMLDDDDN